MSLHRICCCLPRPLSCITDAPALFVTFAGLDANPCGGCQDGTAFTTAFDLARGIAMHGTNLDGVTRACLLRYTTPEGLCHYGAIDDAGTASVMGTCTRFFVPCDPHLASGEAQVLPATNLYLGYGNDPIAFFSLLDFDYDLADGTVQNIIAVGRVAVGAPIADPFVKIFENLGTRYALGATIPNMLSGCGPVQTDAFRAVTDFAGSVIIDL